MQVTSTTASLHSPIAPRTNFGRERIQLIRLQDVRKLTTESLWVINIADQVVSSGGTIALSVSRKDGEPVLIEIPRTWLALDLGTFAPRAEILASTKFMKAVNDGMIGLVSEEVADALNSDPNAQAERNRLNQSKSIVRATVAAKGLGRSELTFAGREDDQGPALRNSVNQMPQVQARAPLFGSAVHAAGAEPDPFRAPASSIELSAHFAALMAPEAPASVTDEFEMLVSVWNDLTPQAAVQGLMADKPKMSPLELQYVADNIVHTNIAGWAKSVLASLA